MCLFKPQLQGIGPHTATAYSYFVTDFTSIYISEVRGSSLFFLSALCIATHEQQPLAPSHTQRSSVPLALPTAFTATQAFY
jgi:hypothetical protein